LAPPFAGAAWLPATDLSAENEFGASELAFEQEPKIAVGAPGDAVAVWPQLNGRFTVQAASKLPGQSWGAAVNLSRSGEEANKPQVAMNAAGQAVAVWVSLGSKAIVRARRRSADGSWGPVEELSLPGEDLRSLDVGIDSAGRAVAVWSRLDQSGPSTYFVEAATSTSDGEWGPPVKLTPPERDAFRPKLSVDHGGHIIVVWYGYNGSGDLIAQASEKDPGGPWSEPQDLSEPGADAWFPAVASVAGETVVVWQREEIIEAAIRKAGGSWQPPEKISGPGSGEPAIAMDGTGRALAIWSTDTYQGPNAEVATLAPGGSWSSPLTISQSLSEEAPHPQVAVSPEGRELAVWTGSDGKRRGIEAASGDIGGGWEAPVMISPVGRESQRVDLDMDESGNAAAVWRAGEPRTFQGAIFDVTKPELASISIPPSARAGRPVSFAASPFDAWTSIGPLDWTFGDGSGATGSTVTHSFPQAGKYEVGVRATDAAGHLTSAMGLVNVTPALAVSNRIVIVKNSKARLELHCPGSAVCHGNAVLARKLSKMRHARPRSIARTRFSIPPGTKKTVTAVLSRKGKNLLSTATRSGICARLDGYGIKARTVLLKPRRRHSR